MTRLTDDERAGFRRLTERGWVQPPEDRDTGLVEPTPAARLRYCEWASAMSELCPTPQPVRFVGDQWKL